MTTDGAAGSTLAAKLGITDDSVFVVLGAPAGFAATLGDTGGAVLQRTLLPPIDVIVAFFTDRAALVAQWPSLAEAAQPDGAVWLCWPKATSGRRSDVNGDVLRAEILPSGWVDNKICAIDDVWSGLRFVLRTERRGRGRRKGR